MRFPILVAALSLGLAAVSLPARAQGVGPEHLTVKYTEKQLKDLEAKLAKKPKDAKLKQEVAEASFQVGYATEFNDNLPPRAKYRGALKLYRRTLALNPKHAKAQHYKSEIESIYKGMGMPVPQ